ncbi:alpha/beta fold hydrolase [Phenylobacterium soli]|uniref:Alpha/beta hydrolase n=1 Tax=Phenylobacterium soli TaxID=2170551 RepID=A0A328AK05_9CAUL|nr:alpha/beta hydrolase [Phenylobacterium soli]RAK53734.1 alpha/beta hydrolase [Phenylobacterium soli]
MDAKLSHEPVARRVPLPSRDGEMAYLDFGPPERAVDLVFSHANGFNARTYRTILGPLAGEMRILAIDLRGHGATTLPTVIEGREGWIEMRDDLLAFLEAATDRPVALSGHSMGGTTSLLAAAAQPDRVRRLALLDPVIFESAKVADAEESPLAQGAARRRAVFPSKAAVREAYQGRGAFKTWTAEQVADYVEAGFRDTADGQVTLTCAPAWEASNFRTHNYDPFAAFAQSRCPIDIRQAEIASTCRLEGHQAGLTRDGRITVQVVPGTSHFLPMERPDVVAEALRRAVAP